MSRSPKRSFELTRERRELLDALLREERVSGVSSAAIPRLEDRRSAPLSFAQQRLWFLDQLATGAGYHIPLAMRLVGPLDLAALEKSIDGLLQRHESLRTVFAMEEGSPVQRVVPRLDSSLRMVDLSTSADVDAKVRALALEEAERPFDLAAGPLFRAALLCLSAEDHVLLVTMHHVVSDGWSIGIVMRELGALYESACSGEPAPFPGLQLQYAEFSAWQRQWFEGEVLEGQLRYWREQLKDVSQLSLPLNHPRPPVQTFRGGRESRSLKKELSDSLHSLSRREGVTLFMTLLAAFQVLLQRYTGQEDIVVGSPIANRNRAELEGLVGFFVNTLALRGDLSGDPSFEELLARTREVALGAYGHQDVPFEKLVEELHPERDVSQNPLFQVVFSLQNAPMETLQLSGLTLTMLESESITARFDLELHVWERPEELRAVLLYNTDLFDSSTVSRMLVHFERLLEGVVAHPEGRISELSLLTEAERRQVVVEWNDTWTEYPREACIHELFELQAEERPDAVAVEYGEEQLTYGALNVRSNRLAHYLRSQGVGPEVLVGIFMERSVEMLVGILGILKAGGGYVPLDVQYPRERLAFMLEDAQASVLLTESRWVERLPESTVRVVCADEEGDRIGACAEGDLVSGAGSGNLAYVMYTSGSTGVPKGVAVSHGAVARLLFGVDYVGLGSEEVLLHLSPASFDASTFEIWGALLHGGRCVLFPEGVPTAGELGILVGSRGVSTLWLTASLFNAVMDESPEALLGVRQLLVGGEALSVDHVRRGLSRLPGTQLINGYGPTEGTTFTCCHRVSGELSAEAVSVPIGVPVSNTRVYLLDGHLDPVPVGVTGRLYIGGEGLARGYWSRAELTAERFIPDPVSGESGSRLYDSGDLARWLPDGRIEYLGRLDGQVKVRGFRIELGEIESALVRHPAVSQVVVLVREDVPGDKRLVAYVVARGASGSLVGELRSHLRAGLPPYMVPSLFVLLDALPLMPNGKVDRQALPSTEGLRPQLEARYVVPRTALERGIAEIWKEVLHIEEIGTHDNFFEIGGHSLLLPRVLGKLKKDSPRKISMVDLFKHPTIHSLAQYLSRDESAEGTPERDGTPDRKLQEGKDRLARLREQKSTRRV